MTSGGKLYRKQGVNGIARCVVRVATTVTRPDRVCWIAVARIARHGRALSRIPNRNGAPPPRSRARPRWRAGRAAAWRHLAAIAMALKPCSQQRFHISVVRQRAEACGLVVGSYV